MPEHEALAGRLPGRHPGVRELARWLTPNPNLRGDAARVALLFAELAADLLDMTDDSAELTAGLRKLVEAKDCCVRAVLPPE